MLGNVGLKKDVPEIDRGAREARGRREGGSREARGRLEGGSRTQTTVAKACREEAKAGNGN